MLDALGPIEDGIACGEVFSDWQHSFFKLKDGIVLLPLDVISNAPDNDFGVDARAWIVFVQKVLRGTHQIAFQKEFKALARKSKVVCVGLHDGL